MAERKMTEWTYGRKILDRMYISPKGQMPEKHGETDTWPKRHLTQNTQDLKKNYHKPITPYNIWLTNRKSKDTNSKMGNRCMALESYKRFNYMKTMYLFSNYVA